MRGSYSKLEFPAAARANEPASPPLFSRRATVTDKAEEMEPTDGYKSERKAKISETVQFAKWLTFIKMKQNCLVLRTQHKKDNPIREL